MTRISRRLFLQGAGGFAWATAGLAPMPSHLNRALRLNVTSYHLTPPRWPDGLTVKAVVLADIHACEPWMPASRVRGIANLTNDLSPDIIFLLGDFSGGHRFVTGPVMPDEWGEALSILKAPLGVHAVLGNHDWWHGALPGMPADDAEGVRQALRSAGIEVLENNASRVTKNGQTLWIAGLGDQIAELTVPRRFRGLDDLGGTLAQINDEVARHPAGARTHHFQTCSRPRFADTLRPYARRPGEPAHSHPGFHECPLWLRIWSMGISWKAAAI